MVLQKVKLGPTQHDSQPLGLDSYKHKLLRTACHGLSSSFGINILKTFAREMLEKWLFII